MSHQSLIIGVVGKPSVGKTTFFNSVTEGKAKVGNYPFTTIEPNTGVTHYRTKCASCSRNKLNKCTPQYGFVRREDGTRFIPVRMIDVAGLVPGASQGLGLGNKFLNDLCGADVLIHIIDVSGTTNEKGEATIGYDPVNDADWLIGELNDWVFHNLWEKWPSVCRRHHAAKQSVGFTLGSSLSGYGGNKKGILVSKVIGELELKDPLDLNAWSEIEVRSLVHCFVKHRFPMILLLNKADPAAYKNTEEGARTLDRNITAVVDKYESAGMRCVVSSANAELFLRSCARDKFIKYDLGGSDFATLEDDLDDLAFRRSRGEVVSTQEEVEIRANYRPIKDEKISRRLRRLKDLMYRFSGTGVWRAIQMAIDLKKPTIAYPVHNLSTLSTGEGQSCLSECHLLKQGTTLAQLGSILFEGEESFSYVEGEDGRRLPHDHVLVGVDNVMRFMSCNNQPVPFHRSVVQNQKIVGTTEQVVTTHSIQSADDLLSVAVGDKGDAAEEKTS